MHTNIHTYICVQVYLSPSFRLESVHTYIHTYVYLRAGISEPFVSPRVRLNMYAHTYIHPFIYLLAGISEPFISPRVRLNMSEPQDAGEACVPYEYAHVQLYSSPKVCDMRACYIFIHACTHTHIYKYVCVCMYMHIYMCLGYMHVN